jgi:hypothetical protein
MALAGTYAFVPYIVGLGLNGSVILSPLLLVQRSWWYALLIPFGVLAYMRPTVDIGITRRVGLANKFHTSLHPRKLIVCVKTYAYYFLHCIFPRRLGLYHTFMFTYGLQNKDVSYWQRLDKWFWGGISLIAIVVYVMITQFYGAGYGLWWFTVSMLPWLNFYMLNQSIADRYAYLALPGLMFVAASILKHYPLVAVGLLVYYATRAWLHLGAFKDDDSFLHYNVYDINFPDQIFVWQLKGEKERALARPFQALESWCTGLRHRPTDTRLHFTIAKTLAEMGFWKEAEIHLKQMEDNPLHDIPTGITSAIPALKQFIAQIKEKNKNGKP